MCTRVPLVVILGSTGSGKTKLSLELAQKFGGEIIGADSMQVYKSLDIITAKATKEEQAVARHHLIDILEPREQFTVLDYRNKALHIIDNLMTQNKLPIVVGGTNYYIESLLWKILMNDPSEKVLETTHAILPKDDYELPSEQLHSMLKEVDPSMAKRLHPNNKRKILRSLEVLHSTGTKHSELLEKQQTSEGGSKSGGGLRFRDAIILWLRCEQTVLDTRLNDRVDGMIAQGLLDELTKFHEDYNKNRTGVNSPPDYSTGIFQSIGFKEFHPYLMLDEDARKGPEGERKLAQGVEDLKMVTRRYARKQTKWTINRFLGRTDREVPPVYGLDTTDVAQWTQNVTVPAMEIVRSAIDGAECKIRSLPKVQRATTPNACEVSYECEVCERVLVGEFQWKVHLASHRHRKRQFKKLKTCT